MSNPQYRHRLRARQTDTTHPLFSLESQIQRHARLVAETGTPLDMVSEVLRMLTRLCDLDQDVQDELCAHGVPTSTIKYITTLCTLRWQSNSNEFSNEDLEEFLVSALWFLSHLTFSNTNACKTIVDITEVSFADAVTAILSCATSPRVLKAVLNPCQNIASYLPCDVPMHVTALVLDLVRRDPDPMVTAECVVFLNILAYEETLRPVLLDCGVLEVLAAVMDSHDMDRMYPLAAVAVANLCAARSLDPTPLFARSLASSTQHRELMDHIMGFFRASLAGSDYPPNSAMYPVDWKIAMAIVNLSRCRANARVLVEAGLTVAMADALQRPQTDQRTRKYCLEALWTIAE